MHMVDTHTAGHCAALEGHSDMFPNIYEHQRKWANHKLKCTRISLSWVRQIQKVNAGTGEQNRRQSDVGGTAAHGNRGSAGMIENIQPDSEDVCTAVW